MLRRASQAGEPWSRSPVEDLSDRELEIFRLIGQGRATRQIAAELHISTSTVETYRERLKTKMGLKNGAELTRRAMQWMMENG
jgi:DNA-binding NarL/FixJ family response regulator